MFSLQIKITNIKKSIPYYPKQQIIAYYPLYSMAYFLLLR